MSGGAPRLNAFTVDVEDYFQVENFAHRIDRRDWERFESRLVENTERVLALLAAHRVQATFFILGWNAERFPELVRRIGAAGHEIASHGYHHRLVYEQKPDEFTDDIAEARRILEAPRRPSGDRLSGSVLFDHRPEPVGLRLPPARGLSLRFEHLSHPAPPLRDPRRPSPPASARRAGSSSFR